MFFACLFHLTGEVKSRTLFIQHLTTSMKIMSIIVNASCRKTIWLSGSELLPRLWCLYMWNVSSVCVCVCAHLLVCVKAELWGFKFTHDWLIASRTNLSLVSVYMVTSVIADRYKLNVVLGRVPIRRKNYKILLKKVWCFYKYMFWSDNMAFLLKTGSFAFRYSTVDLPSAPRRRHVGLLQQTEQCFEY